MRKSDHSETRAKVTSRTSSTKSLSFKGGEDLCYLHVCYLVLLDKTQAFSRMKMKMLPEDVKRYKRTPLFADSNVPKAVLTRHNTKPDTWGLIHVVRGKLKYTIFADKERNGSEDKDFDTILSLGTLGVIEPQVSFPAGLIYCWQS
jgi:tellurite resistance-related uncharacterized protein